MLPYIDENRRTKEYLGYSMIPHLAEKSWLKIKREKIKWGRMCCKYFQTLIATNKADKMNFQILLFSKKKFKFTQNQINPK